MQWKNRFSRLMAAAALLACTGVATQTNAQCTGYTVAAGPGSFVAGTTDVGLYSDDGTAAVTLPFPVTFYGASYNSCTVSTNGTLQFTTTSAAYVNACLPTATFAGPTIFPFWDDQYTVGGPGNGLGIFTGVSGVSPNREFVVEWRTVFCCTAGTPVNVYEVKFYEGSNDFDVIYSGTMADRCSATIGCQAGGTAADPFTQFGCNTSGVAGCTGGAAASTSLRFTCIAAVTSGACCINSGSSACIFTDAAGCTTAGGTFNGIGTSCATLCPAHACCISTGGCIIVGTTACPAGTTDQGAGTTCAANPCPGEECSSAIVLGTGSNVSALGDLTNAGPVTLIAPAVCATSSRDMFYSYTPATSGSYAITTCNSVTGTLDTVVSIHSGCPGDGSTMIAGACSDDNCTGGVGPSTVANFSMDAGTTYIIRVARWNAGAGGPFRLDITSDPFGSCCLPAGTCQLSGQTACSTSGGTFAGGATCSTAACLGSCCDAASGACTLTGASGCAGTYAGLGTTCTTNPCAGQACCNAATGVCSFTGTDPCPSGTTAQGSGTVCSPNPCPQPPGQACSSPLVLTLGVPQSGDLATSNVNSTIACSSGVRGLWYSFTAPTAGSYLFRSVLTSGTGNPSLGLFANDCVTAVACVNPCAGTDTQALQFMNAGDVIIFRAGGCGDVTLTFDVSVNSVIVGACCNALTGACTTSNAGAGGCASGTTYQGDNTACTPSNPCPQPPPPANDECANAQVLALNVAFAGSTTQATGDGTEGPGGACYTTSATNFGRAVWFSFTAPASDVFGITACGSAHDTVLSVFEGTCAAFVAELGCDDDACDGITPAGSTLASIIAPVAMNAGQTYLIRLASWGAAPVGGTYTITVTGTAPAGVCCRGGTCTTTITSSAACTGSLIGGQTAGASFSSAAACNAAVISNAPCCYADYNKTGGITVTDIFNFLTDWFAGSPFARIGSDGSAAPLAVQNIFDFLTNWFAGGC